METRKSCTVIVKCLEWREAKSALRGVEWVANEYWIRRQRDGQYHVDYCDRVVAGPFADHLAAKQAAQEDFDKRIRNAIEIKDTQEVDAEIVRCASRFLNTYRVEQRARVAFKRNPNTDTILTKQTWANLLALAEIKLDNALKARKGTLDEQPSGECEVSEDFA